MMNEQEFLMVAPGKAALLLPVILGILAPVILLGVVALAAPQPADWPKFAVAVSMLPVIAAVLAWTMHHRCVSLSPTGLRIRGAPWRRITAFADLDVGNARIVNLDEQKNLRPGFKIAGARLPGFRSGWFWLRDGRRAYVVLTDWRRTVELPRKDGRVYLFSLQRPEAFIDALGKLTR